LAEPPRTAHNHGVAPGLELREHIALRLDAAGHQPSSELVDRLAVFTALLAKWNRRLNLTGFSLEKPSDEALDRLIVEPVLAARFIRPNDQSYIDVGSGGGSPAIPVKLCVPRLTSVLVEARAKKCAFLRESVRELGLADVRVVNATFEDYVVEESAVADVVTVRAVAESPSLWASLERAVEGGGRILWFSSALTPSRGWLAEAAGLPGLELSIIRRDGVSRPRG